MYRVVILPSAVEDIKKGAQWYNIKQPKLGNKYISYVRAKISSIRTHPQVFPIRYGEVQTAVVDVFPYMIHFIFLSTNNSIVILAVLHTSRNPETWQGNV